MKFFSKITFICNFGFLVFVILAFVELNNKRNGQEDNILPLPYVQGLLVILGQFAIFINLIFCLTAILLLIFKRMKQIPGWLAVINFMFLIAQVYYFFIYKN